MKRSVFSIALPLALLGCSDADTKKQAIEEFVKACQAPVSAKFTLSQWNNGLELSCPIINPKSKSEVSQ